MAIYKVVYTNGRPSTEHATMADARRAVRDAMGWDDLATSDEYASEEGARGSVYGVECYRSRGASDAAPDGDPYAPRILIMRGPRS